MLEAGLAVGAEVDREAGLAQALGRGAAEERVIFDDQDAPGQVPLGRMTRSTGVPSGPDWSGKNTRWVVGSTATECE